MISKAWFIKSLRRSFASIFLILFVSILVIFNAKYIHPSGLHQVQSNHQYVLDKVHLVMVEEQTVRKDQQLIIRNGIIEKITDAGSPVPQGYEYHDGQNAFVTPGLFDMHVHHIERKALALSLAHGVTSVRMMRGYRMHLLWREELKQQQWLGSHLYLSSPVLASPNTHALNQAVTSPEHADELVEAAKTSGFDVIKLYGYQDAAQFEAIITRANQLGITIAKHGPHPAKGSDWQYLNGLQSLEHVEDIYQGPLDYQFDSEELVKVVSKIKKTGVPVTPTLAVFDHLSHLSNGKQDYIDTLNLDYLNPVRVSLEEEYAIARWLADTPEQSTFHLEKGDFLKQIVNELHRQGVDLLVGSDSGMMYMAAGVSTHNEMALLKQSGLTDFEVIKAATINPAIALKVANQYGSIKVGKVADLVITLKDPGQDIRYLKTPYAVVKHGQWVSREQLDELKESAKTHPNFWLTAGILIEDVVYRFFNY
jgi:cytosine/adenosine deaminase-related metal-dependent hydrolase